MSLYTIIKVIPFENLTGKILKQVSMAAKVAEESDFDSSKRLGASLEYKGSYFLWS